MLTWFMLVINLAKHFRLLEMSFFTKPLVFPVVLDFKINVVHFFTLKCAKPKHKLSNSDLDVSCTQKTIREHNYTNYFFKPCD